MALRCEIKGRDLQASMDSRKQITIFKTLPMKRNRPPLSPSIWTRITFENLKGDVLLAKRLCQNESANTGADDENMRTSFVGVGGHGGNAFNKWRLSREDFRRGLL